LNYYCENIEIIRKILKKLDANDAVSIKEAKQYISKAGIKKDLAYIKSNFTILTVSITKLQEQGLPLAEAINVFETLQGPFGKSVFNKLNNVTHKNVSLKILKNISNILSGITMNIRRRESGVPTARCILKMHRNSPTLTLIGWDSLVLQVGGFS
jgi:hypothetical protein